MYPRWPLFGRRRCCGEAGLPLLCCCVLFWPASLACSLLLPQGRVLLSDKTTGSDLFEFPPLRTETSCLSIQRPAEGSDAAYRAISPSSPVPRIHVPVPAVERTERLLLAVCVLAVLVCVCEPEAPVSGLIVPMSAKNKFTEPEAIS